MQNIKALTKGEEITFHIVFQFYWAGGSLLTKHEHQLPIFIMMQVLPLLA
jgi:hypothetical protein